MLVSATSWLKDREVIHRNDSNGGLLVCLDEGGVAKVFPSKGYLRGWFRIFAKKTKAHKQFRSMQRLRELGLWTPEPLGVQPFPPDGSPYEGALIYRFAEGVSEVREALNGPLRETIFENLADDLITMAGAGVLFVDLHLGNILVDENGRLCWIDVEVKEGAGLVRSQFWSRIFRMHRKCDPGVLSEEEWVQLCSRLKASLSGFKDEPSS